MERESEGPFRQAVIRPTCALCGELTEVSTSCPRCGRPLCAQHVPPGAERRCTPCEEVYAETLRYAQRWSRRALWVGGAVFIAACAAAGMFGGLDGLFPRENESAGHDLVVLLLGTPVVLAIAFGAFSVRLHHVAKRCRRRFLRERAPGRTI
jgi:hypothetical protein